MNNRPRTLYISYTGMMEPLGQSQVLQYLFRLTKDHEITLVSFEKKIHLASTSRVQEIKDLTNEHRINWIPVQYHKKPRILASAYDIMIMSLTIIRLQLKHKYQLVHCRSYVAGISGLLLKQLFGTRFLFDMRGFWPDERVDGGIWKRDSWVYSLAKSLERKLLSKSDHVVSLTESGVREIKRFPYIDESDFNCSVIPTCTNLNTFKPQDTDTRQSGGFRVGMVGSVGSWYLFDEMLQCFNQTLSLNNQAQLLIVNKNDHEFIRSKLKENSVEEAKVEIVAADYSEVSKQMSRMDIGLFFIKPVFSKQASAPTKLGEFLGCGIPCISNAGVGDMDNILEPTGTGVCVRSFDANSYKSAYKEITEITESQDVVERCRKTAETFFALDKGAEKYAQIYKDLLA